MIIKAFFEHIRKPSKRVSISRQIVITSGIALLGFFLGVFQKWIDGTGGSSLPLILQQLDIGNYFGRLAIWILLGTIISVLCVSLFRSAYMVNRCNSLAKNIKRVCYRNRLICCYCFHLSTCYAVLGIKYCGTEFIKGCILYLDY